jgi:glycosyltransferase involved in cell wall biosynthesis
MMNLSSNNAVTGATATVRLAFVTSFLDIGGSTTWLCDLTGEFKKRGVEARVFSLRQDHPFHAEFEARGVDVVVQDDRRLILEERLQATLKDVRDFQPTVVVGWVSEPAYEVLRYVPQGIPRILVLHSDEESVYQGAKPYGDYADYVIVLSHKMAAATAPYFQSSRTSIRYIRLGVEVPESPLRREHLKDQPLRILYIGRLHDPQKRVRLFPTILRDLAATGMPFTWTIAGDGPERAYLESAMLTNNPSQVARLIGNVAYSEVPALLCGHDVFLLPSAYEGMPHTLLEAMGHGLVPVVTDLASGIREVIDETNGKLVELNDIAGYARAIHGLHEHRDQMITMSLAAQERVREKFSIRAMTDEWMALVARPSATAGAWPERFEIKRPVIRNYSQWTFPEPFRTLRRLSKRFAIRT